MIVLYALIGIAIFCAVMYHLSKRAEESKQFIPMPRPAPPKPFTPLADSLEGKLPPVLPRNPLPKERPLPKRSHRKKEI